MVLKRIGSAVAVVCVTLGGCMQIQPDLTSAQYTTLAATQDDVDAEASNQQDSYFEEYAPWRTSARRLFRAPDLKQQPGSQPVKVASVSRGRLDTPPVPELFPEDPEELKQWLAHRSEQAKDLHRAHMDRLREMDQQSVMAVRSICTGC